MGGAVATSGTRKVYHVYRCQKFHVHGRSVCHCNGVSEAPLLATVVRKMQTEVFSERAIGRLLVKYRKRLAARRRVVPVDDGRLRKRIEDLDRQIDQGAERVLTAPDNLVGTLYGKIEKLREQRERLQADLNAAGKPEAGSAATDDEKVEEAAQILRDIREAFTDAEPEGLRGALPLIVSKIELHYKHVQCGKKERNLLQGGTIFFRSYDPAISLLFGNPGSGP